MNVSWNLFRWGAELNNSYLSTRYIVEALLYPVFLEDKHSEWMQSAEVNLFLPILLQEKLIWPGGLTLDGRENIINTIQNGMSDAFHKNMEHYRLTAINLGLAHQCSIFDSFLNDLVKTAFAIDRAAFYELAVAWKIGELNKAPDLQDDQLFNSLLPRMSRRYAGIKGIKKRLGFFKERYGVPIDAVFKFEGFENDVALKYGDWGLVRLEAIYMKRNKYIHAGELGLITLEELLELNEFLRHLTFTIFRATSTKLRIRVDVPGMGSIQLW